MFTMCPEDVHNYIHIINEIQVVKQITPGLRDTKCQRQNTRQGASESFPPTLQPHLLYEGKKERQ